MQIAAMINLNNPQIRQDMLAESLNAGAPLVVTALADQLGVSIDTIRRDLIALEQRGLVRRVRGGAVPVTTPMANYMARAETPDPDVPLLAERAVKLLKGHETVFLDAGTTMNAVAAQLPLGFAGLIVTPAPSVALAALARNAEIHLIGGALCPEGAMATGGATERAVSEFAADVCFLGACGLWPDFGLSSEEGREAGVKRAMAQASVRKVVVTSAGKFERLGRHRVLELGEISTLVTDANDAMVAPYRDAGIEVING